MCKGGLFKGLKFLFVFGFLCLVLFLPLPSGVSPDGSCFDVFGYTELKHLNGCNHVLNVRKKYFLQFLQKKGREEYSDLIVLLSPFWVN